MKHLWEGEYIGPPKTSSDVKDKNYICQYCGHDLLQAQALIGKHHDVMKFHFALHARDDIATLLEEKGLVSEMERIYSKYGISKGR